MQNIGERLEEARKRKGISIREAAEATKVRGDYLHKFESNQFDINLPDIYVRGFLRNYANYLGLPAEKIINDYNGLGHASPAPKPINREIYGRMDLSVSSASRDAAREPDGPDAEASEDDADSDNPATFKPKAGAMPYVDRALVIKGVALLGGVSIIILISVIGVRMLRNSGGDTPADPQSVATSPAAVTEPQITVHAIESVRIKVVDEATNAELFQGPVTRGDSRSFSAASILLTADPMEHVEVEMQGRRYPTGLTGRQRVRVQLPE